MEPWLWSAVTVVECEEEEGVSAIEATMEELCVLCVGGVGGWL